MKNVAGIIIAVLLVALFAVLIVRSNSAEPIKFSESDPVIGASNAPITIVMFSRYGCTVSKRFFSEMYPLLKSKYIDTGKVKLVYKHHPAIAGTDEDAETASLCANEQEKFLEYHLLLLEKDSEWRTKVAKEDVSELFNPILGQYAQNVSIDYTRFMNCLQQSSYKEKLYKDYAYGKELGVSDTPFFFVNGIKIEGLPSWKDFESLLLKFN